MQNSLTPIYFEKITKETDLAWLLLIDGSDIQVPVQEWLPKSLCEIDEDTGVIHVPEWLAIEKELV